MINIENELPPEIGDEIIQDTENQDVAEKEYRVGTVQLDEEVEETETESDGLFEHHRFVNLQKEPPRVDKFLMDRISFVSRSKIQTSIKAGSVLVNDKEVKANHKLRIGDVVTVVLATPPREGEVLPENIPLDVVYEDDDLMVINKPAGLVVHPGLGNRNGTLVNALAYYFKSKGSMPTMNEGEKERLGLVHRIDKDTSGLLLIAKTEYAMTHLAKQFFNHTVHRRYVALVWGDFDEEEGTVTGHIGRDPKDAMIFKVFPEGDEGSKHAITHYKVLERFYYTTLVECRLETGRTHQIRVHMRYIGHTLFSDKRYGGNRVLKGTMFSKYKQFVENTFTILPRQALHAKELGFVHPTTGEAMLFKSEMPTDIMAAIEKWRHYVHYRKGLIEQSIVHPTITPEDF
jgi:23S rRNA pseudouridine1911/1915/1917 synthase